MVGTKQCSEIGVGQGVKLKIGGPQDCLQKGLERINLKEGYKEINSK